MNRNAIVAVAAAGVLAAVWARWAALQPAIDREAASRLREAGGGVR
jgi:hypothetical protein